jgi:DNA-binding response OmpR family regulator
VTTRGSEALDLARRFLPSAITLDIYLPDMLAGRCSASSSAIP